MPDLITVGRVSMDLFAENIGAPFVEITGFETGVGGSPSNIAIGSARLGLDVALLTAVGEDEVGRFVRAYLEKDEVDTSYIPTKANARTGMAVVGVQPPDQFPLVFYRENPADVYLTIEDAKALPLGSSKTLLLSGTALSRGTCRDTTLYVAEAAAASETVVFMDLDLRPDQWSHPLAYGLNIRSILPNLDVVIGTEEEFIGALALDPGSVMDGQPVSPDQKENLQGLLADLLSRSYGPGVLIVKRGAQGVTIYTRGGPPAHAAGFPVEILNTVGAGDAFASGLIFGRIQGWDWYRCARFANACGAIVVTRHGCGTAMPTLAEVEEFVAERGGL